MSHRVYIALGTNIGDRTENLRRARQALVEFMQLTASSPVYETPPWGIVDQPAFLNQVVTGQCELAPEVLMRQLKKLEGELGRVPGVRNGPRVIDLDLLFYDDLQLEQPALTIPHPRMEGRAFVLKPLADLAPDLVHPVLKKTITEMLQESDASGVRIFA